MPLDVPFSLGPFRIDDKGGLSPGTPDLFPSFRLCWQGHWVQARLASDGQLVLSTTLGRVVSTGRSTSQPGGGGAFAYRPHTFALLHALPAMMPSGWQAILQPDHSLRAEVHIPLTLPARAETLIAELTLFLLRLAPYLDLLAEEAGMEGVTIPAGMGGTATGGGAASRPAGRENTCPG